MMLGERSHGGNGLHVTPWSFTADEHNASADDDSQSPLQLYLPSNTNDAVPDFQFSYSTVDAYSCDHFRMYEFKIRMCTRARSHDWTECPYAHPGEKARRRDPTKFHYSGTACPDFRKGCCLGGDACEFAHGVFECWLHPVRYRTQPCKDGLNCTRRVCFFAHSPDQLRVLSPRAAESYDGLRHRVAFVSSSESDSTAAESPPISPMAANSVNEVVASLRRLQLNKVDSMPSSWMDGGSSPLVKTTRPGYFSLPSTPTGIGYFDGEEEPVMERVESGRDLRARMFEKLIKENPLDRVHPEPNPNPDLGWVSELVK